MKNLKKILLSVFIIFNYSCISPNIPFTNNTISSKSFYTFLDNYLKNRNDVLSKKIRNKKEYNGEINITLNIRNTNSTSFKNFSVKK